MILCPHTHSVIQPQTGREEIWTSGRNEKNQTETIEEKQSKNSENLNRKNGESRNSKQAHCVSLSMLVPSLFASLARFLAYAQPSGRDADSEIHKFGDVSAKWALKLIAHRVD